VGGKSAFGAPPDARCFWPAAMNNEELFFFLGSVLCFEKMEWANRSRKSAAVLGASKLIKFSGL